MIELGITKFMILQSLWWLVDIERSKRIHWRRDVWKHKTYYVVCGEIRRCCINAQNLSRLDHFS